MGLSGLFTAAADDTSVSYTFDRFVDGYSGLKAMAKANGRKVAMRRKGGKVEISLPPAVDYANKVDSDLLDFTLTSVYRCVNHLVCAGTGELEDRAVVHFYADAAGNVSRTQSLFGVDEISALYDYSNADEEKLEEEGRKKLQEYQTQGSVEVEAHDDIDVDVGDVISARDNAHGRTVSATVAKKIVKVSRGVATYSYEVGSETTTKTSSSGNAESNGGHAYFAGKGLTLTNYTFDADVDAESLKAVEAKADGANAAASNASAAVGKAEAFARAATGAAAANAKAIAGKQDALTAGANVTIDGATISATDTTYGEASATASGLMSAADKAALDGLATGATVPKKAETAGRLAEARTVTISGAVNGSATWDGSGDLSIVVAGDSAAAGFLASHPVGTYMETSGYDPSDYGGEWSMVPSIGPYTWLRIK